MKKAVLVCLSILAFQSAFSQEGFRFEIQVSPNSTYTTLMETESDGIIEFDADQAILDQMKANGVESPMTMKQESQMTMVAKTENKDGEGNIAAVMKYENMVSKTIMNDKEIPSPNPFEGVEIRGIYNTESKFQIDSIVGGNINQQMRTMLTQTMEMVQKQIEFPDEPLKIGDSFENQIPMTIPMQGMNPMEIIVNTVYKLKEVTNGKAHFDLEQSLTLDTSQDEMKMSASGTGTGTCTYSIADKYLTAYESELPMTLAMEMNAMMRMNMKMDTKTALSITIE